MLTDTASRRPADAVLDAKAAWISRRWRRKRRTGCAASWSTSTGGLGRDEAQTLVAELDLGAAEPPIIDILVKIYGAFCACDGELLEINPLALTR